MIESKRKTKMQPWTAVSTWMGLVSISFCSQTHVHITVNLTKIAFFTLHCADVQYFPKNYSRRVKSILTEQLL